MTAREVVEQLEPLGTEGYRNILRNHGVPEPLLGVKIEELKKLQKQIKRDHRLALDLYDTGIYDARYLAGLIVDDRQMTRDDLCRWLAEANCGALQEYTVPWVAVESGLGLDLAREWIESPDEGVASAGWATLSGWVALRPDSDLDLEEIRGWLRRIRETLPAQPNRVRYGMNSFVIAVGCYVAPLTETALETAAALGVVKVDMGKTACKVPPAADYIRKVQARGTLGKKRKTVKC